MGLIINNANIINEGKTTIGSLLIEDGMIKQITSSILPIRAGDTLIDGSGKYLIPGVIDSHVHFREPGLTHKADIASESRAAVAGGITTIVDMPNTSPATTTIKTLDEKYDIASKTSLTNYSFYIGATNNNIDEILKLDPNSVFGVKVFMGSSTGDMLVNNNIAIEKLFEYSKLPISTHCEEEAIIKLNTEKYKQLYANKEAPTSIHPQVRNRESCITSTKKAIDWAKKYGTKLNILHLSTADEVNYLHQYKTDNITAEACISHLYFDDSAYMDKGNLVKCNPSIKSESDRKALVQALSTGIIDIVSTDHAPHTTKEKEQPYFTAPSGIPIIQYSLLIMIELYKHGEISLETIVERMCHAPARIFNIDKRGFIREEYHADLTLFSLNENTEVTTANIESKCKWSPLEGRTLHSKIDTTIVNGNIVYANNNIDGKQKGEKLKLNR